MYLVFTRTLVVYTTYVWWAYRDALMDKVCLCTLVYI